MVTLPVMRIGVLATSCLFVLLAACGGSNEPSDEDLAAMSEDQFFNFLQAEHRAASDSDPFYYMVASREQVQQLGDAICGSLKFAANAQALEEAEARDRGGDIDASRGKSITTDMIRHSCPTILDEFMDQPSGFDHEEVSSMCEAVKRLGYFEIGDVLIAAGEQSGLYDFSARYGIRLILDNCDVDANIRSELENLLNS